MKKLIYILLITHSLHVIAHTTTESQQHAQALLKKAIKEKKTLKYKPEPIPFTNVHIEVDTQGYPTIKALQQLMQKDYFPKKHIEDIVVTPVKGGAATGKIYAVSLKNKPKRYIFFLKISTHKDSAQRLAELQIGPIGKYMIQTRYAESKLPVRKKDLPIFAWVEKFYLYNHTQIIEVTHAAQGQLVYEIMSGKNQQLKIKLLTAFGKALGSLQQIFMNYNKEPNDPNAWKTICHLDLHAYNMLFNPTTSKIYFIDTEMTRQNCHIWQDIVILGAATHDQKAAFFNSYIATFPKQQQEALQNMAYIKDMLSPNPKLAQ